MNPILKRTLCGLTVGAGVIAMFLYCPLKAIPPVILMLSMLLQLEFYQMAKKYEPVTWLGMLMGAVWISALSVFAVGSFEALTMIAGACLAAPVLFALSSVVLFSGKRKNPIGSIASTVWGFFYVPFMLGFFILLVRMGRGSEWYAVPDTRIGLYTLFYLIAVAKLSDTGGFAFGVSMGRHKMCPTISPNKSWEGLAGSAVFASVTTAIFIAVAQANNWGEHFKLWDHLTYAWAVPTGIFFALVGTAGDLIESRFKRECGVKDSATFMPAGMGGFLDMFDSFIFLPAIVYPTYSFFQYIAK